MFKATILFHKCFQNAQEYGTTNELMISRVFFSLQLPDKRIDDLHADIKQTSGDKFEGGSIEVGHPEPYKGPLNYSAFRDAAESYYRKLVGPSGEAIRWSKTAGRIALVNNWITLEWSVEIEIDTEEGAW